jgi:chitin disaccharide deacetylase
VDLGEWEQQGGEWRSVYQVIGNTDNARAVRNEVAAQLRTFRQLVGRDPTHIDSHQHAHKEGPARHALWAMGRRLGVPVRHQGDRVQYCGSFYGQGKDGTPQPAQLTPAALKSVLAELAGGTTELCTHPGEAGETGAYGQQRAVELQTLCDPSVRETLRELDIKLISFTPPPPHPLAPRPSQPTPGWRERWGLASSRIASAFSRRERRSACEQS